MDKKSNRRDKMDREQQAEMLKEQIYQVRKSKNLKNKDRRIITCHVEANLFIEMAYCFIYKYGK
jgi:hypothetical protein